MRTLHQIIAEEINRKKLEDYVGEDIVYFEDILEQEPLTDYVNEMLMSHPIRDLNRKIQKEVLDRLNIFAFFNIADSSECANEDISFLSKEDMEAVLSDGLFNRLLKYYNYYITSSKAKATLKIEPLYTDKVNDYIFGKCHGIAFHIVKKDKVKSILSNGLRCKGGRNREYPEKVFLYATENIENKRETEKDLAKFAQYINHVGNEFAILRIDLNQIRQNIDFYKDSTLKYKGACYAFNEIPAKYIKFYKNMNDLAK